MKMTVHHIAYAVRSTEESIQAFAPMYPLVKVRRYLENDQRVYITYLAQEAGGPLIELVEAAGDDSPVRDLVTQHPATLYHVGYMVDDFDAGIRHLKEQRFFTVTKPFASGILQGIWESHLFHPMTGMIEIMGKKHG